MDLKWKQSTAVSAGAGESLKGFLRLKTAQWTAGGVRKKNMTMTLLSLSLLSEHLEVKIKFNLKDF